MDTFFPAKDRMALALQINNILAAPTFDMWRSGQTLDVASLLFTAGGRPRQSVFYLAHLSDSERMFFVTILFSAVETWMRTQPGATSLRALLYMDEIFGYLPPTATPPSKQPLLRMLKQARAFGLGLVLATQNPVDVDYKALSNAGTWFIGKLQTEQDKQRLLDGLESAASGALDRGAIDKLISGLGKRIFIMQNVHESLPVVFQTRWTMNFLAGPMTRTQIPALNKLVGASNQSSAVSGQGAVPATVPVAAAQPKIQSTPQSNASTGPGQPAQPASMPAAMQMPVPPPAPLPSTSGSAPASGSVTRPAIPSGFPEFFLPMNLSFTKALAGSGQAMPEEAMLSGILYRAVILASAQVRFLDRRYSLDMQQVKSALVMAVEKNTIVHWDNYVRAVPDETEMDPTPDPQARFAALESPVSDARLLKALQKDFADWTYRTGKVAIRANSVLGVFATPEVSQADFMKACVDAARTARDADLAKATATLDRQIAALQEKLARAERDLQQNKNELEDRKREELVSDAETVFSLLGGRRTRRISSTMSKHRMTEQTKAEVDDSTDAIAEFKRQLEQLEQARQQALDEGGNKWGNAVNNITEIPILPKKTDIYVTLFGIAWMPYYQAKCGDQMVEIPAFQ